jgi:hypothetical protein
MPTFNRHPAAPLTFQQIVVISLITKQTAFKGAKAV